ncbi:phosphate/phosphite/phosphonate ABC transporter substrate-binding protein [Thiorhodococcus fuscus]|uniref:Phosphate/phosphite/phosphonate ABC transporter substrate-binding protein n=1 Tax=Thiorhodococcus fuscus TaxID=527200 RepID=A0ABW4YB91_9GAMM
MGVVSERPEYPELTLEQYQPFHRYLSERLEAKKVAVGKLGIAAHLSDMRQRIERGEVDLLLESLISTLTLERQTNRIHPELLVWRKGQRQYRTLFFARKDSPIRQLTDLRGKHLVFESERSTSAFFIPLITLETAGVELIPTQTDPIREQASSYAFAGSELNQAYWVQRGKAEAGAFNDGDWKRTPDSIRKDLRIFHTTPPILRYIASYRDGIPPETRDATTRILVEMSDTETGRAALAKASHITRIEPLTDTDRAQIEHWRQTLAAHDD